MIRVLVDWLSANNGAAPIKIRWKGDEHSWDALMVGVDQTGIATARKDDLESWEVFPWAEIEHIAKGNF